jgi:5S rRNA maturation endonuclease (ribonuclease M5)
VQASSQEIQELKSFISTLNLQTNSVVIVEGKRDSAALKKIGYSGVVLEFHKFGGLIKFADSVAQYESVIILLDRDRK